MQHARTLLFVVNDAAFFLSHREPVANAARDAGFRVVVATAAGPGVPEVVGAGYEHREVSLSRSGRNPFNEARSIVSLLRLFRSVRPDVVHLVTIKPVLYGGIAARIVGVPGVVSVISGLGIAFSSDTQSGVTRLAASILYRFALGHRNQRVLFQNANDRDTLVRLARLRADQTTMLAGSGVNLSKYGMTDEAEGTVTVVMASRLLREKGVYEFVDAARIVHGGNARARFLLVGEPDPGNPTSVSHGELDGWRKEGLVEILGFRPDIATIFSASHIVVLPSYYGEGLPKVLAEAAACGRAVVTTDMPGCRDAIEPGKSGILVPPRDAQALSEAIEHLIARPDVRKAMGRAGRSLAERRFDVDAVIEQHLSTYDALLGRGRRGRRNP